MTTLPAPPAIDPSSITLSALYPGSPASNVRSSQNTTNRCGSPSTRSAMSGRSTRSALSTSMSRRPFAAYFASIAFTSDDLPVPREPVSSTLFAGRPGDELPRVAVDRMLLVVDGDEVVHADRVRMRDRLQIAAPAALAPAGGGHLRPVGVGLRRRKQRLDALEDGFGAADQAIRGRTSVSAWVDEEVADESRSEPGVRLEFRRTLADRSAQRAAQLAKFESDPWRPYDR